jgi:hypothetical protein
MTDIATYIDSISRRVRDATNTAHSRDFIRDVFTRASSVINSRQEYIIDTVTITAGTKGKAIYTLEGDLGGISRLTEVEVNNESLEKVEPWRDLWKLSATWLTDTSDVPLAWAAIGRDRAAIYPAPLSNIPITFSGVRGSFQTLAETEETGLRDEDADIVREITVALILLRWRDLDMVKPILGRMGAKMNIQSDEISELMRLG